ncbi:MAG: MATE family efflux transporter [Acutalibacteraceae bacterium]
MCRTSVMLFNNFSFGFSVYVGQNFGARLAGRIRRGVREIFLLVGGLSVLASALSLIFAEPLVLLYVKPEETQVIEASLSFVRIQSWFFPFLGWIWLYNSTLKGMGKIGVTMISSFVELGSKIGLSILLPIWIGYTGIWFSAPIGWILGLIPNLIYYYGGFWQRALPPLPEDAPAEPSPEAAG